MASVALLIDVLWVVKYTFTMYLDHSHAKKIKKEQFTCKNCGCSFCAILRYFMLCDVKKTSGKDLYGCMLPSAEYMNHFPHSPPLITDTPLL